MLLLVSFSLSLLFTFILIRVAPKIGLIDVPNQRSTHSVRTPRGAGIGIFIAVAITLVLFDYQIIARFPMFCIAALLIFIVGVLDDHNDAPASAKIYIILLAAVLTQMDGFVIDTLGQLGKIELRLSYFAYIFTLFAILAFTNALNLIDGLDGLSSGASIVMLSGLYFIGYIHSDTFITSISSAFILALVAFLIFNWNPAKIFMGDSGSLVLGFVISVLSIKAIDYIPPVSILLIAALPIMDSIIVLTRRRLNGVSFVQADQTHIHHIMLRFFKNDVKRTVVTLILLQSFYTFLGVNLANNSNQWVIFILFVLNLVIYYLLFTNMHNRQKKIKEETLKMSI